MYIYDYIFMEFDIWEFFENLQKKSNFIKFNKHNGHFTSRPIYIYDTISQNSS